MPKVSEINSVNRFYQKEKNGIIVTSPRHAFYHFGFNTNYMNKEPKLKHTFLVNFVISEASISNIFNGYKPDYARDLMFDVKSVDKPKYNFDIQTLNQYNKKRLVQQNIDYQPINVRFYDKANNAAIKFLKDYTRFYFGDVRYSPVWGTHYWSDDIISNEMFDLQGFGFSPISNDLTFLDNITVFHFYNRHKYDRYVYVNPKIQTIDFDTADYSDSQVSELNVTFMYESVLFDSYTDGDEKAREFRMDETSGVPNISGNTLVEPDFKASTETKRNDLDKRITTTNPSPILRNV